MKCQNCGIENLEDAKFCKNCGFSLNGSSADSSGVISDQLKAEDYIIDGRFKILRKLGKGGMGEVFLAEDVKLTRQVAIKNIITSKLSDPASKARFLREAQTASQLDHPNICTIYEIYEEGNHEYIVMQYVDGVTLDHILKIKSLSYTKILDIALQVCHGMVEANAKEVIHRDIKPSNVMVDKKGVVKILDFGLAKFGTEPVGKEGSAVDSNLTEKGIILGTVSCLSPEQATGKLLDHRTDVFSFGILLYEMIESKNPFKEENQISTLYNILNKEVEFSRDIPEELKNIILQTLQKDRKKRYQGFSQLKDDLEQFQSKYNETQDQKPANGHTEVIEYQEKETLLKEVQKSSDKEELGDLVYRIKKFKAYTEPVLSTKSSKIKFFAISFIAVLILLTGILIINPFKTKKNFLIADTDQKFYIYLHRFENTTKEKNLSQMVGYLLTQSLNQFEEFKAISAEDITSLLSKIKNEKGELVERSDSERQPTELDLKQLQGELNLVYQLNGAIKEEKGFYEINCSLSLIKDSTVKKDITMTGANKTSFLEVQVDGVCGRIYENFFPERVVPDDFKKISKIFGTSWVKFSNFFQGYALKNKLEITKAIDMLRKSNDLAISRLYLADLYWFESSNRKEAEKMIESIKPELESFTDPLKYKALAMEGRLGFDFQREIENLQKLKENFGFSKEVFYELGETYFRYGDAQKAIENYKQALEYDNQYSKALNHLGYCFSYQGRHKEAIDTFEQYYKLDRSPNSFDSFGDGFFYQGKLDEAENFKKNALKKDERGVPWAYQTLSDIYILKAIYSEAKKALQNYNRLKPSKGETAKVLSKIAYILYVNRDFKNALKQSDLSLKTFDSKDINANTAEAHWIRSIVLLALNKVDESRQELGWLQQFTDNYKLSEINFSAAFKHYIHLQALIFEKDHKLAQAEENFKLLVKMKPRLSYWITYFNYQYFHTEYVKFLFRTNKLDQALEEVEKCLEYSQNYIPALWQKARIMEGLKDNNYIDVYRKIWELYGDSNEKNVYRELLKVKLRK